MTQREQILADMEPLFKRARREGLWFHCSYQDLWFSPDELEREHAKGSFIWGACNWRLRDPKERLASLAADANSAKKLWEDFAQKIEKRQ